MNHEVVERCLTQLFAEIDAGDESTGREIEENDKALHDAPSYYKFQDFISQESEANSLPGHEMCISIQAGFQLGLRVARELAKAAN